MKFSIVTPSFNQIDWLRLCVASIRDQGREKAETLKSETLKSESSIPGNFSFSVEHIIQDAGTPGIEEFAREIGADFYRDGQLVFLCSEKRKSEVESLENSLATLHPPPATQSYRVAIHCESDSGMYDAVNRGFRRASGDIFAYLNCDEQYLPGSLRKVTDLFASAPDCDVIFCDAIVVDSGGHYLCDRQVMVPDRLHTLVSGNLSVFTSSTFSRAGVFTEKGLFFDKTLKVVGDAEWAVRLAAKGLKMKTARLKASVFADTGDNLSLRPDAVRERKILRDSAPKLARLLAPLIVFLYRLRRLAAGAYRLEPHTYEIFTPASPNVRQHFSVTRPTFQWPGR